jgi:antitoxin component YwqK of YwqJK toxin-antitoxin module
MKKLLPILCVLIIGSCSQEIKEITADRTVQIDGLTYEVNSQTPFTGKETSVHSNGKLKSEFSYKNGKRHGPFFTNHENGKVYRMGNYKEGKWHGLLTFFNEDGLMTDRVCLNQNEKVNMSNCDNES